MVHRLKRFVRGFWGKLKWIRRLVTDPRLICNYYPERQSKSRFRIVIDNLLWLLRFQEHNEYYYAYGFDTKPAKEHWCYGGHLEHRDIRDKANRRWVRGPNTTSYCGLVADKFVCGMYLTALGMPTPKIYGLAHKDWIFWTDTAERLPLESILSRGDMDVFCKEVLEGMGIGICHIQVASGKLKIDGAPAAMDDLKQKLVGKHVLQERIAQHEAVNRLYASSVNTFRLITIYEQGQARTLAGVLRIGVKGMNVDNWTAGGLVGPLDLETGKLGKYFLYKPGGGGRTDRHPDSGIVFEGYTIPFVKEAVQLSLQAHELLYGIHSIGWDIAITPEGPTFIEANDEWGVGSIQVVHGGLMPPFFESARKLGVRL